MLLPSLSIISFGVAITAILMAINWHVGGLTQTSDFRQPSRITPMSGKALIGRGLARLVATNQAVLPHIATKHYGRTARGANSFEPAEDGFKHVA
jgi:hypothetical protein